MMLTGVCRQGDTHGGHDMSMPTPEGLLEGCDGSGDEHAGYSPFNVWGDVCRGATMIAGPSSGASHP